MIVLRTGGEEVDGFFYSSVVVFDVTVSVFYDGERLVAAVA